jgi:hypothetical protein
VPFGLNTKSLAVGVLLGWLVLPRLQALVMSKMGNA